MAELQQRMIYVNGTSSYLLDGDPDSGDDRFFSVYDSGRRGAALPRLLAEGWRIASVTAVDRRHAEGYGAALVVLERGGSAA